MSDQRAPSPQNGTRDIRLIPAVPQGPFIALGQTNINCVDSWSITASGDPTAPTLTFGGQRKCDGPIPQQSADADLHLVVNGVSTDPAEAVAPHQECTNCANLGTSGTFGPAQGGTTHRLFYRHAASAGPDDIWIFDGTYCALTRTATSSTLTCTYTTDYTVSQLIVEAPPPETQYDPPFIDAATSFDPVHTLTGSFSTTHTDVAIPGRGPSPLFVRTYNSNDTRVTALGPGWTHSYSARLRNPGDNTQDVIFVGPQGRSDRYVRNADGTYTPPPAVYATLVKTADGNYTLTFKDRTVWSFDPHGQLTKIADRYGNASLLSYNSGGQPAAVSDPAGRGSLVLQYDASGRLAGVVDWTGRTVRFAYDPSGRLASVTDREGRVTTFAYDGTSPRLTTITDPRGNVAVTNTYDAAGRVATQRDARGLLTGQQTDFTYVTNPDGTKTTLVTYPATSFDPFWRAITQDTYDTQGRLISRTLKPTVNGAEWPTWQYGYDANGDRTTVTDPKGNLTRLCYDFGYDGLPIAGSKGNLTRRIDPAAVPAGTGPDSITPTAVYRYDAKDNLIQAILPKSFPFLDIRCNTNLAPALDPLFTVDLSYDAATSTKLESVTRRYTDPDLGQRTATTKYEYTDAANPGRLTRVIPPRGNTDPGPDPAFATVFTYFSAGSGSGLLQSVADPLGNVVTYGSDAVGRVTAIVDQLGNAPGGVAADHTTTFQYDGEDRLRFFRAPAPASGGARPVTEFRYDAAGNRIVAIDANGQVRRYAYDERELLGEVRESASAWTDPALPPPSVIVTAYAYDHLGRLSRVTRASGDAASERATDYAYDGLGRLRRESEAGGGTGCPGVGTGQGVWVAGYRYDLDGDRTKLIYRDCRAVTYAYDPAGRLASLTDFDGQTTRYRYAPDGKLSGLTNVNGTTAAFAYDNVRRLTEVWNQTGAGQTISRHSYTLDAVGDRIRADELLPVLGGQGSTLARSSAYGYDGLSRLVSAAGPDVTTAYAYDPVGNRIAQAQTPSAGGPAAVTSYTYDRADRIQSAGAATYASDANGNVTSRTGATGFSTFTYDQADRLTSVGLASMPVVRYRYDGDGVRRSSTTATPGFTFSVEHIPDVNRRLPVVMDDGLRKYVWGQGLAYSVASIGLSDPEVHHSDGLGSTRALTVGTTVTETYRYDEFGQVLEAQGTSAQPFLFTGQQRDLETGFLFLRARYYDPAIGRFIGRDRWSGVGSSPMTLNRYAYVRNNPTRTIDPSGLTPTDMSGRATDALLADWRNDLALPDPIVVPDDQRCPTSFSIQGIQSSITGNLLGAYVAANFSLLRTPDGQFGAAITFGGGGGSGVVGLTGGVGPVISNARSVSDYGGFFGELGGSAGLGLGFATNAALGNAADSCRIAVVVPEVFVGGDLTFAGVAPLPAEAHGFATDTWVQPW